MAGRRLFRRRSPWVPRARILGFVALGLFGLWFAGFLYFLSMLPRAPLAEPEPADGIVALTGGADRLVAAMALLTADKGQRLLISGVHANTSAEDLKGLVDDPAHRFDCCVDVDRVAGNTIGNAAETARWARQHGYRSLIVVTAQYHMPRSLLELSRAMPGFSLRPFPVFPESARTRRWWYDPGAARLFAAEYSKYLISLVRGGSSAQSIAAD